MRVGIGYDVHQLRDGLPLVLGGITIPHNKGPLGHSDGDVLLHAICDAILGALGKGDIGQKFPDTDPAYKDISSLELLKSVAVLMAHEGFKVSNLDSVIVTEEPKVETHREEIQRNITSILKLGSASVSIKGKTNEKLGEIGAGNAIAAYAVVLLVEKEKEK